MFDPNNDNLHPAVRLPAVVLNFTLEPTRYVTHERYREVLKWGARKNNKFINNLRKTSDRVSVHINVNYEQHDSDIQITLDLLHELYQVDTLVHQDIHSLEAEYNKLGFEGVFVRGSPHQYIKLNNTFQIYAFLQGGNQAKEWAAKRGIEEPTLFIRLRPDYINLGCWPGEMQEHPWAHNIFPRHWWYWLPHNVPVTETGFPPLLQSPNVVVIPHELDKKVWPDRNIFISDTIYAIDRYAHTAMSDKLVVWMKVVIDEMVEYEERGDRTSLICPETALGKLCVMAGVFAKQPHIGISYKVIRPEDLDNPDIDLT